MEPAKENVKIFLDNRKLWMNYLPPTEDNKVYVYPDYGKETLETILKYSQFEETEVVLWASFTPPTTHFLFHYDQHASVLTTHGIYYMREYERLFKFVDLREINSIDVGDYCYTLFLDNEGNMIRYQQPDSHFRFTFIHGPRYMDDEYQKIYKEAAHVVEMMIKTWQQYDESLEIEATPFNIDAFLALSYQERKIIMPTKRSLKSNSSHVTVFPISESTKLSFPVGHPVANHLYVGHPFLPHKYIPFENYQLELVEDKVREFCQIAQCLGAIEISIDTENGSQSNGTSNYTQDINGGIGYKGASIDGGIKKSGSKSLIEEISQAINLHQTFTPTKAPYLPSKTVWYQNESSWQRLYEQRMIGGFTQHEERIETKKSQVVDNQELQEIKTEVRYLFASANLNWSTSIEESFSQQENAVLSINVKFAPIESIGNNVQQQTITPSLTDSEQEYLDMVKDCLEDGEMGSRERKLLDKIRVKNGISEERAKELESTLTVPQLTDEEKEYFEAFKDACEDGKVSENQRRLLEKLRVMYGISEERARELENN